MHVLSNTVVIIVHTCRRRRHKFV